MILAELCQRSLRYAPDLSPSSKRRRKLMLVAIPWRLICKRTSRCYLASNPAPQM